MGCSSNCTIGEKRASVRKHYATASSYDNTRVTISINSTPRFIVNPLFDTTRAYRNGSTIPIKLELTDGCGANVSSANIVVTAYDLQLVGGITSLPVLDSGSANPDSNFRYVSGGNGGSYMFNLSAGGLGAGTYELYFHVGNNNCVSYDIQFEIR